MEGIQDCLDFHTIILKTIVDGEKKYIMHASVIYVTECIYGTLVVVGFSYCLYHCLCYHPYIVYVKTCAAGYLGC